MSKKNVMIGLLILALVILFGCAIAYAAFIRPPNPVVIPVLPASPTATFITQPTVPWQPTSTPFPRLKPTPLPTWAANTIGNG